MNASRDYKTHARTVSARLTEHAARMAELIKRGLSREQASKQALSDMRKLPSVTTSSKG